MRSPPRATRALPGWNLGRAALLAPLACLAAACDGSDGDGGGTSFNAFVHELVLENTADDTEPVSLDGFEFRFDEDPDAFDDLFP
jgi:hypothetical protein